MDQNESWLRATTLPPTETRITQAFFMRTEINRELDTLIETAPADSPLAAFSASWIAASKEAKEAIPAGLTPILALMLHTEGPSALSARIGWMNRNGIPAPIGISLQGDPRNQRNCRVCIEEGWPSIGIPEYWLWPENAAHRRAYRQYVDALADAVAMPALRLGYAAENEFAHVFPSALERRKRFDTLTWTELCARFRVVDWTSLLTAWGLAADTLPHLRYAVTSEAFLHHLQHRMVAWSPVRWQGWLALLVAQWVAGCSPHGPLRTAWFAYNRRFLQGMLADDTPTELRHAAIRTLLPNTLGRAWVARFCSERTRTHARALAERIRGAAIRLLSRSWLAAPTRTAAVRKLRAMDLQIGWPDEWATGHTVTLEGGDLVDTLMRIARSGTERNQALRDCRSPTGRAWPRPVYEVNAFYYPEENRLLLPAAILRPPLYDERRSEAWNLGAIGATIGHELCHAFDSEGRLYDEHGNKRDWWTSADDRAYTKRAHAVQRLYETQPYRGLAIDGELTLVENIADIGGVEFALEAFTRSPSVAELREFFVAFAISWRSKDRLKRAAELAATDPHAPPMLRVNHVVRQMDEWYTAFGIDATCPEFIPVDKRIRFFRSPSPPLPLLLRPKVDEATLASPSILV